jgi:Phasin protein
MAQYDHSGSFEKDAPDRAVNSPAPAGIGLDVMNSMTHGLMRANMEAFGLLSRRARAQMDLSKQAMECRTPAEFGQLGAEFWRTAFQDYFHYNQRLTSLWTQTMTAAGQGELAKSAVAMAGKTLRPLTEAARDTGLEMAEHPTEPWAWWRTDVRGLMPHRNGHSRDDEGAPRQ